MSDDVTIGESERIRTTFNDGLDRLMNVSAEQVYAEPVRVGDRVVIPAAAIEFTGGFGFGTDTGDNGGGGGGGHKKGRPVAIIEAGPDGVRIRPVIDFTRVALTVLAAALTVWQRDALSRPSSASSASKHTSERIRLRQSARCRLSFSPWMRLPGSSGPMQQRGDAAERVGERTDERDRAAHAHQHRVGAEPGAQRAFARHRTRGPSGRSPTRARLRARSTRTRVPTARSLHVRAQLPHDAFGILSRSEPQLERAPPRGRRSGSTIP